MLLDVNQSFTFSLRQNISFNPFDYVNSVSRRIVCAIHIAAFEYRRYILDTHDIR